MIAPRKVLIADDDAAIRMVLGQAFTRAGYDVRLTASARTLLKWAQAGEGDLALTDVLMPDENALEILPRLQSARPDLPVIVISAQNTLLTAVKATQVGAFEYLPKPFDLSDVLSAAERALSKAGAATVVRAQARAAEHEQLPLIGRSPAMQAVYAALARLVDSSVPVLLTGESGVGKALTARTLYDLAKGRKGEFVSVSLAGLSADRLERELVGLDQEPGALARADGGALLLDKVDDLPAEAQAALLRILDGAARSGGAGGRRPRIRLIATARNDLAERVRDGRFREDLYYRLNIAEAPLPPLRERLEDIPDLAQSFLLRSHREGLPAKTFEPAAIARLQTHAWPGNVRELENLVRRLVVLYPENLISARAVDKELSRGAVRPAETTENRSLEQLVESRLLALFRAAPGGLPEPGLYRRTLDEVERALFRVALAAVGGNQLKAARLLGVNRNTLHSKLGLLALDPRQTRAFGQADSDG